MERQIQMQLLMRERMIATQLARSRDLCCWWGAFYVTAATGLLAGWVVHIEGIFTLLAMVCLATFFWKMCVHFFFPPTCIL